MVAMMEQKRQGVPLVARIIKLQHALLKPE
jgi:hypothetical protein